MLTPSLFGVVGFQGTWLVMAAIAVLWNPVFPFAFTGVPWLVAHIVASALCVVAGVLISVPREGTGAARG